METQGIYLILNLINYKVYVGSSIHINVRQNQHISQLKNNHHTNDHLQKSWNKYGEHNFKFIILENNIYKEDLQKIENYWINYYNSIDSNSGYNKDYAKRTVMLDETKRKISEANKGRIHSEETRKKIGDGNRGKIRTKKFRDTVSKQWKNKKRGDNFSKKLRQANLGKKHTTETKNKISKNKRTIDINIIIKIKKLLKDGLSQRKISKKLNVARDTVYKINVGKTYSDIII